MELYALSALVTMLWWLAFRLAAVERRMDALEQAGHPNRLAPPAAPMRRRLRFRV